jgi:purine-cytosine permease-like protein
MIFETILLTLATILIITFIVVLRQFYFLKKGFDEILIKIMQDHEMFINGMRSITKEFKNRHDDISKLQKDINTIRANLKILLDEYNNKIKSILNRK